MIPPGRRERSKRMYFDHRLWALTRGLRGRMALGVGLGGPGAGRRDRPFRLLGYSSRWRSAGRRSASSSPRCLWRGRHHRAPRRARPGAHHGRAPQRGTGAGNPARAAHDKIVALGPAWFGAERTGGVMLSVVDGVEQLQTFFGQYLPQLIIAVCAPLRDFRLYRVVGCAGRRGDAGRRAVRAGPAVAVHRGPRARSAAPASGVQVVRRGIPRRRAGPADVEGVRPERAPTAPPRGEARALSDSTFWVLALASRRAASPISAPRSARPRPGAGCWRVTMAR